MKKVILSSLFCLFTISIAFSQADDPKQTRVYRPDIPGSFKIDWGFNFTVDAPDNFSTRFFPTNSVNLYYQYPFRFGKSNFSFNPGAGVSFERFAFDNNVVLTRVNAGYELLPGSTVFPPPAGINKTILSMRYVDIPLEFRFDTKPEDVAHSFNFALGGRAGFLIDSMMKVKYDDNYSFQGVAHSEKVTNKDKQNFGLTKFRYGVYSRFGVGAFNLFFFYNLSPTFQANDGPDNTKMTTFSTGISINGF